MVRSAFQVPGVGLEIGETSKTSAVAEFCDSVVEAGRVAGLCMSSLVCAAREAPLALVMP